VKRHYHWGLCVILFVTLSSCSGQAIENGQTGCVYVDAAEVNVHPTDFADRPACLRGTLRYLNGAIYIAPDGSDSEDIVHQGILMIPARDQVIYGDLRSFDRVEVDGVLVVSENCFDLPASANYNPAEVIAACQDGPVLTIFADNARVLSREVSPARCQLARITDLYEDPLAYNETVLCTEGYIAAERTGSVHDLIALVPADYPNDQLAVKSVDIDLTARQMTDQDLRAGDRIAVRGRFLVETACFQERDEAASELEAEVFCWPVAMPMWITNPEIELVQ